ncbi:MFS transporter [Streptomyces sp. AC550_RSS872]|uniref:MFS transporter n=1 Tax=Streptomyces sp. AC550_RSS872 TaxID=2823689 RepID=UPI0026661256|nr:MFS transporter [Streptomyces sp. AC550_RSS872]
MSEFRAGDTDFLLQRRASERPRMPSGLIALTAATARLPRKQVLVGLLVLFVIGNLLSAVAPSYPVMLLGRIVAALCHRSFFGIGSLVARDMVAPEKKSRAVAVMFAGLTVANVLCVPFGALCGERRGWRAAFWAVTAIGVLAPAGIVTLVPGRVDRALPPTARPAALRAQLRALRSWQVWLTLAATALGHGGMFGAFSYIAHTFTEAGGFSSADVAWLLMVYGVGLVVGNLFGGRAADHDKDRTLVLSLLGLTVTLAVFGLLAQSAVASVVLVFLLGLTGFAGDPAWSPAAPTTPRARHSRPAPTSRRPTSATPSAPGSEAWPSPRAGCTAPLYVGAGIVMTATAVMTVAAYTATTQGAAQQRLMT